jgi:hypothetical protein
MAQMVKTQIVEIDSVARSMESSSNGFRVVRKHASDTACDHVLLENYLPSVVARGIQEMDYLMVSVLSSRVFAIADNDRSLLHIDIGPFYPADLGLAHCSRDREANNSSERYELLGI